MAVYEDHRATSAARRSGIIRGLSTELSPTDPASSARRLGDLIRSGPRRMIASGDVDGLVSAAMLASSSARARAHRTGQHEWSVSALIIDSGYVLVHPEESLEGLAADADVFGVDAFSTRFPSASNHPLLWGRRRPSGSADAAAATAHYDAAIQAAASKRLVINPSLWVGIEASLTDTSKPLAASYRYPLGTAQILLAALEAAGANPGLFDREYLPWLIAHCDGGLDTIRRYHFNVPMWWSAMAASVGPSSNSEQIYQIAVNQRATEFIDVDRRLRFEDQRADRALNTDWNLVSGSPETMSLFVSWLTDVSGWPDPIRGGAEHLPDWTVVHPDSGSMRMVLPSAGVERLRFHLDRSLEAVHTSFSFFDGAWKLGWLSPGGTGRRERD